ncbi:TIGR02808 family protein [Aestuariirhabdus sp. Z084]|nr:TIGR02808 family protein [Aestuariirhabdus haliotis]MCL6416066.1 TIGR02808 family protein [Aestuariirhabdus haliotis]MCL6419366.1 TIGR02808 family protein [Aestuariirhabdus haliotis]
MSAMESLIWTLLGYAAMPTIFIAGFVVVAIFTCFLLDLTGNSNE